MLKTGIFLDTNILIALLNPDDDAFDFVFSQIKKGHSPVTNSIAWHECIRGPLSNSDSLRLRTILQESIFSCTAEDAEIAARLFNQTGRRRSSTADCLIVATALRLQCPLFTRNRSDFELFKPFGLKLV